MIRIDMKDAKKLERDLRALAARAIPFATKETVNTAAFTAQKIARRTVKREMVQRNRFTQQGIRVNTTKTLQIRKQAATVGSIADYMETQEFGGMKKSKGKQGIDITTSYAAGEGLKAKPRRRLARGGNKMAKIKLMRSRRQGKNRRQRNLIAVKQAASTGRKFVFLDLGRKKGIFKVIGGKRRPRIRMVHDLSERTVSIPPNPWLKPSVDKVGPLIARIYAKALQFQIDRQRLLRKG